MSKEIEDFWNEIWVKVPFSKSTITYDYYISSYGRVKSYHKVTENEKILKGSKDNTGRVRINVRLAEGAYGNACVHKFVAEHFVKKISEADKHVIHKDYDIKNNVWTNLAWVNTEEWWEHQMNHPNATEIQAKRSKNWIMTASKVRMLKKLLKRGKTKKKILAKSFGITTMQLNRIERGENWGHVTINEEDIKEAE